MQAYRSSLGQVDADQSMGFRLSIFPLTPRLRSLDPMHINCVCGEDGGVDNVMPNAKPDDTTKRMQLMSNIAVIGIVSAF